MNFAQFFAVTAIFTGIFFAWLHITDKRNDAIAARDEEIVKLRAMVERYASECGECAGVGITIDDEPCAECADIRALLQCS
jgi:hypothetical protein